MMIVNERILLLDIFNFQILMRIVNVRLRIWKIISWKTIWDSIVIKKKLKRETYHYVQRIWRHAVEKLDPWHSRMCCDKFWTYFVIWWERANGVECYRGKKIMSGGKLQAMSMYLLPNFRQNFGVWNCNCPKIGLHIFEHLKRDQRLMEIIQKCCKNCKMNGKCWVFKKEKINPNIQSTFKLTIFKA